MRGLTTTAFPTIFSIVKDTGISTKSKMLLKYYLENKANVIKTFFISEFQHFYVKLVYNNIA